jgi:hypothetical protein
MGQSLGTTCERCRQALFDQQCSCIGLCNRKIEIRWKEGLSDTPNAQYGKIREALPR